MVPATRLIVAFQKRTILKMKNIFFIDLSEFIYMYICIDIYDLFFGGIKQIMKFHLKNIYTYLDGICGNEYIQFEDIKE